MDLIPSRFPLLAPLVRGAISQIREGATTSMNSIFAGLFSFSSYNLHVKHR